MSTVQTNVRVQAGDKPLVRAIAARLRIEPRFRDRLTALLDEDPTPALQERIEKLEEHVDRLLAAAGETRVPLRSPLLAAPSARPRAEANGSPAA